MPFLILGRSSEEEKETATIKLEKLKASEAGGPLVQHKTRGA